MLAGLAALIDIGLSTVWFGLHRVLPVHCVCPRLGAKRRSRLYCVNKSYSDQADKRQTFLHDPAARRNKLPGARFVHVSVIFLKNDVPKDVNQIDSSV